MRKLVINGLLVLVFVLLVIALFSSLFRLRATDATEEKIDSLEEKQQAMLIEEKQIAEETTVKVSVSNATTNTSSKTSSSDEDIDDFLSELD